MLIFSFSAAFVGFLHSLAPAHWVPIVLVYRGRKWNFGKAMAGAVVAASGHIFISMIFGLLAILMGHELVEHFGEIAENYAGLALAGFGVLYTLWSYFTHHDCSAHGHHGPKPVADLKPFVFLFMMGFSPCVAALPFFISAATIGPLAVMMTVLMFTLGVLTAFLLATILAVKGLSWLDHPLLEHHGDTIAGLGIILVGLILFFSGGHAHSH